MRCPSCGQENRQGRKFCSECASPLELRCPRCDALNEPGEKFCGECAAPLSDASPRPDATPAAPKRSAPIVATHPSSFANGRYQIKELIGEGGKKRVYQAHDTVLDRDVALAVIKTEGLDPTSRVRTTREAQAMARLGDHPHVLQIFDLGEDKGQPYMVLPLMPGGDVGTLLEKAEDHRLPVEQAVDLAIQICRGLDFAHSKGIVHRDLKPGNIWLTADGTARIGDFGLAVAIDRSRLTQEGMMVGTVSYMPPEQAMGGEVTLQSDLYSLGAMLYEMVCGRPPFLGDESVAIIGQHINTPPVAPTWHNSECPRALEALILRLLTKDPSERPGSAADVLTALEGINLTADVGANEHVEAHALDSLAGGVFVGRQREMGELRAALEDALSGRGRLVMLVGEPGIGKTRTAEELATYAGLRGCQVLWGRCYESRGAPPYWPWVQAIRSYARERDPERLRSEMGAGAADIAEIVSDVRERLPDLKPPPELEDPEQARFRLFDSITAFLKSAGQSRPIVVMLDDLHWADKPSLLLLEFLVQEFADSRLLVIGTYRDVDVSRQHPLAETLGELTRERLFQRVLLRGLSQQDVGRFIEITSGIAPPRGLVSAVHTQTEGNPLFVTEVVRLLVQEGELSHERTGERDSWEVRIPEGVREVIGRRLNRLSARCNQTLTIASVIGREFELRQLAKLVEDMSEDRLLEVLEEALSSRVIEELPQAVGRYGFTHALIQQTLYDELTTTRRVRLQARIVDVLEELYGDEADTHAVELAHHTAEAEAVIGSDRLVHYSCIAGKRALATYAWEDALVHLRRALTAKEAQPIDAETAEILSSLGSAQAAMGQPQAALANLACAFDYYADTGDRSSAVAVAQTPILHLPGQVKDLTKLISNALTLVPPDSAEAGQLLPLYGTALGVDEGDYEGAQEAFARALTIARRDKNDALEMEALVRACSVDGYHLRFHEGLQKSSRITELIRHLDDPGCEATYRFSTALALWSTGDLELANLHADAYLAVAERLRHRFFLGSALWAKEILCRLRGDFAAARGFNDRGLAFLPRDPRLLGTRALMEFEIGEADQGKVYLQRLLGTEGAAAGGAGFEQAFAASIIPSIARISGLTEWLDVAERAGETVLSFHSVTPLVAIRAKTGMAWLAVVRRDPVAAEKRYAALEPNRGTLTPSGMWSVDHLLGLLAHIMGNLEVASGHFEAGLTFCRNSGCRPEFASAACDYTDMLRERDGPGDRAKAMQLLDESLAISSDLGMRPLMERVLSRKMSLQGIDVSSPQTSIDAVVSAVEVERPNLQPHAAPDGTVTVMFTDIEGSTAMTERLGDQKAQDVIRIHNAIIREQTATHQGFEVKSQGDGFMLAFSSARRALECAIAVQRTLAAHNAENPAEPIKVRIGLHTGEAIKEGEDFFGKTVILAARIASQANGGQILVSSLMKALVESSGEFEFGDSHEKELKGLSGTHPVFDVKWNEKA